MSDCFVRGKILKNGIQKYKGRGRGMGIGIIKRYVKGIS